MFILQYLFCKSLNHNPVHKIFLNFNKKISRYTKSKWFNKGCIWKKDKHATHWTLGNAANNLAQVKKYFCFLVFSFCKKNLPLGLWKIRNHFYWELYYCGPNWDKIFYNIFLELFCLNIKYTRKNKSNNQVFVHFLKKMALFLWTG